MYHTLSLNSKPFLQITPARDPTRPSRPRSTHSTPMVQTGQEGSNGASMGKRGKDVQPAKQVHQNFTLLWRRIQNQLVQFVWFFLRRFPCAFDWGMLKSPCKNHQSEAPWWACHSQQNRAKTCLRQFRLFLLSSLRNLIHRWCRFPKQKLMTSVYV